ncbi:unnamed protein product [Arabidopsis lyrata]|nr:unnamed protein product [Arabidopsis lyrata]
MKQREAGVVVVYGLVSVRVGCSRGWLCGSSLRGSVPLIGVLPVFCDVCRLLCCHGKSCSRQFLIRVSGFWLVWLWLLVALSGSYQSGVSIVMSLVVLQSLSSI